MDMLVEETIAQLPRFPHVRVAKTVVVPRHDVDDHVLRCLSSHPLPDPRICLRGDGEILGETVHFALLVRTRQGERGFTSYAPWRSSFPDKGRHGETVRMSQRLQLQCRAPAQRATE